MHLKKTVNWIKRKLRKVRLVDRYVILVMVVLLVQSVLSVFLPYGHDTSGLRIDVVLRTTMVSIFGYLASSNFIARGDRAETAQAACACAKNMGNKQSHKLQLSNLQVRLVGQICLFSVILLLLIRYFVIEDDFSLGYVYLYRDFISSGIGFLIGMPSDETG